MEGMRHAEPLYLAWPAPLPAAGRCSLASVQLRIWHAVSTCRDDRQAGSCALTPSANHPPPVQDTNFQAWFKSSQDWLQPYAAFLFLKDLFGSAEHWRWGALAEATPEAIQRLVSPDREFHSAIRFTYWMQWHLHRQLLAASRHAASRGVALKGDLPIGEQFTASTQLLELQSLESRVHAKGKHAFSCGHELQGAAWEKPGVQKG